MIRGGCLCGAIRYGIDGPLTDAGNCHCSMCRRFHGAAFGTYAKVGAEHFRWLSGAELLSSYETSPGIGWAFCRVCGSSLGIPSQGKLAEIALGTLDGDPGIRPARHIFVGSRAAWFEITDTLPQHDAWPPASQGSAPVGESGVHAGRGFVRGHALSDADQVFRDSFESFAVAPAEFNHEAHVRLAYVYLAEEGDVDAAVERMRAALLAFLAHHGIPSGKYHETLTRAWVLAVRHFMDKASTSSAADFVGRNPDLLDSRIMLTHYSATVLFSPAARAAFVEPDLDPIPHPRNTL